MRAMSRPTQPPIGVVLRQTARDVTRAFDAALADAGGTHSTWQILLALKAHAPGTQRELAAHVGIEGATLTHHLDGLERAGLVTRSRDPENRRVQRVALTEEGEAAFHRLRRAAQAFDRRLRSGLEGDDEERLRGALAALASAVEAPPGS
jgi:MarR family transcriptional regulator for hemolysin